MDRFVFIANSGARHSLEQQATVAQNLANASTTGYRAQKSTLASSPVTGEGLATRTFVLAASEATDFTPAAIRHTDRDLDVAIEGKGFFAVQAAGGGEAYTRDGGFNVGPTGMLESRGRPVLGDGGPIAIPPEVSITIGKDGTVSTVPTGNRPNAVAVLGRLKLVDPAEGSLQRGADGLFRTRDGSPAPADEKVRVISGSLEASNVNVVEAMVEMISLARQFEMHMKVLQNAETNERDASQIMATNR